MMAASGQSPYPSVGSTPGRLPTPKPWPDKYQTRGSDDDTITIDLLTPLPIPNPYDLSKYTREERDAIEAVYTEFEEFQKDKLKGFTTRQLYDLDAITNRRLRASTLNLELHPAFRRDRWEVLVDPTFNRKLYSMDDLADLPDGLGGEWVAGNDLVWRVIVPALRIATYIISSAYLLPFIDGLFFGQQRKVENFRRPPNEIRNLIEVVYRNPLVNPRDTERKIIGLFSEFLGQFNFILGFKQNFRSPWDGTVTDGQSWAITGMRYDPGRVKLRMFLSWEMVFPLMRPDLNDAERMGLEWFVANTFCHELIHAMWFVEDFNLMGRSRLVDPEPYMGNDTISELGWAFEFSLFGGSPTPFRSQYTSYEGMDGMTSPLGFWLEAEWPTLEHAKQTSAPILLEPLLYDTQTYYPIPASFYEDMQDDNFWNVGVRNYGWSALHGRSRFLVSSYNLENVKGGVRVKSTYDKQTTNLKNTSTSITLRSLRDALNISPEDKKVYEFGANLWGQDEFEKNYLEHMGIMSDRSSEASREMEILGRQIVQDPALDERELYRILTIIDEARTAHEGVVKNLINFEKLTSSISTSRRQDLLIWNRDTREMVYQIQNVVAKAPIISPIQKEAVPLLLRGLEWCAMTLWSPDDYQKTGCDEYVPKFIEAIFILSKTKISLPAKMPLNVFGQPPPFQELQRIATPQNHYPELFANLSMLLIVLFDFPQGGIQKTTERKVGALISALVIIRRYRDGFRSYRLASATFSGFTNECPEHWVKFLDTWIYIGGQILAVHKTRLATIMEFMRPRLPRALG